MFNPEATNSISLIAATFTPMTPEGHLALDEVSQIVNRLIDEGVTGLFTCGGTGEGVSLSGQERMDAAEAFVNAAAGRVPVIVHVGQNSLRKARELAAHAAAIGADAIAAMSPTYFKPDSIVTLIDCLKVITSGAPDLPFIYYHFPKKTGLTFDVATMLQKSSDQLPSLRGVKFTDAKLFDMQACLDVEDGRYTVFFGWDEMMLNGLVAGARGAIGSTYNFAAPLYKRIINAYERGDYTSARQDQALSVKMIRTILPYGGLAAQKAVMALIDSDCGPTRLPIVPLSTEAVNGLRRDLDSIGFFRWAR